MIIGVVVTISADLATVNVSDTIGVVVTISADLATVNESDTIGVVVTAIVASVNA